MAHEAYQRLIKVESDSRNAPDLRRLAPEARKGLHVRLDAVTESARRLKLAKAEHARMLKVWSTGSHHENRARHALADAEHAAEKARRALAAATSEANLLLASWADHIY